MTAPRSCEERLLERRRFFEEVESADDSGLHGPDIHQRQAPVGSESNELLDLTVFRLRQVPSLAHA